MIWGRVVIPKEIRRTMGIREGEPPEIYLDTDSKGVIFRKYDSGIAEDLRTLANKLEGEALYNLAQSIKFVADEYEKREREE